jgi:S-adenosylmethionine decarboxylase
VAEYYRCSAAVLNDVSLIREHMMAAARVTGATILGETFHQFSPHGVSGTVVISESHLSIHTWPENGYVAVDIYTCGGLDPRLGFRYLAEALGAEQSRVQEILRGLPEDMNEATFTPDDIQIITKTGTLQDWSGALGIEAPRVEVMDQPGAAATDELREPVDFRAEDTAAT